MMIITTRRSSLGYVCDALLTALAWFAFLYLFTNGVLALAAPALNLPELTFPDPGRYRDYLTLVAVLTLPALLAMGGWHIARERLTRGALDRDPEPHPLDTQTLADHFSLSSHQLNDVQTSRVTVIYHSGEGRIDRLETDRLQLQPAGVTALFDVRHAA
jgi:biofilm PGA synthesis protein PgaD